MYSSDSVTSHVFCYSGDIQIGMVDKKGALEVEVIRARGLVGKPGSKALPGIIRSQLIDTTVHQTWAAKKFTSLTGIIMCN